MSPFLRGSGKKPDALRKISKRKEIKIKKFTPFSIFELCLFITLYGQGILWESRIDLGTEEEGRGIAIDSSGNIFIAGSIATPPINYDLLLIKCNPQGETIWTRTYGDSLPTEESWRITTDLSGNIYIAGYSMPSPTYSGGLLLKFSNEGKLLWVGEHWLPPKMVVFLDVVTNNQNNIFVAGVVDSFTVSPPFNQKALLCRYDTSGNLLWAKIYDWAKYFLGITQGSNGNLYLTGEDQFEQTLTVCVDTLGDTIWTRKYNWGEPYSRGQGIAIDFWGNVIVTGFLMDTSGYFDLVTIKYTQDGDTVWTRKVNFLPYEYDWGFDVATDNLGNIYVCGNTGGDLNRRDYFLIKYTSEGDTMWTRRYGNRFDDFAYSIALDRSNNPIITGASDEGTGNYYDVVTIKYRGTIGIEEDRRPLSAERSPLKIHPNPARTVVHIRCPANLKEVKIYDACGKLVLTADVQQPTDEGWRTIPLTRITAGIYFIKAGKETAKLVVRR